MWKREMVLRCASGLVMACIAMVALDLLAARGIREAGANGFTLPVASGTEGPYQYTVGIWPHQPVVGTLHLSITLSSDQRAVTDAAVYVSGAAQDAPGEVEARQAYNHFLSPESYEVNVELTAAGRWDFTVDISSSLGDEQVAFALDVEPGQQNGNPTTPAGDGARQTEGAASAIRWAIAGVLGLVAALIAGLWAARRLRHKE